ncbi:MULTISPECIES: AsnC family transcriptional regulator [unclassified Pseudonocardia]|uniref:AsnC family transcriptional regulator n=1 Tax=unclassified Pseudonocardia TaxID=2619320 RepID=UPI001D043368|nr:MULTISPECIES: AsnC family transcriptional regulator [unclassified Pseudonocardia]
MSSPSSGDSLPSSSASSRTPTIAQRLDDLDRRLLDLLQQDGRASFRAIADDVDASEGMVRHRVNRMLECDVAG